MYNMQPIHVYVTGCIMYEGMTPISNYLFALMRECGANKDYTLFHSGLPGVEEIAVFLAKNMGWNVVKIPTQPSDIMEPSELCRRILAKFKPSFVALFRGRSTSWQKCQTQIDRYCNLANTKLQKANLF